MDVEVAIVGGGPVGLTLANLLGRRGISVTLFEKQSQPYPWPRAIHFDGEVMRCFQATGLADALEPHIHVGKGMLFKTPDGETVIDWSRAQSIGPTGWFESYRFFQPGLEAVLRDGLTRFPDVTLHMGADVIAVDQAGLTLGSGARCRARFIVAADGAASPARQSLGIDWTDLGFEERWLVTDLRLRRPRPDLGDYSIQFCDVDRPATYVRGVDTWRRWEMRLPATAPDHLETEAVWQLLSRWITPEDATLDRAAIYTFRSRIASRWRVGTIFLAGDAAHQMPPFMGQGMCAGIRDAANLAWKLAAVLGGAPDTILDTYASERVPNVRAFIDRSVALGRLINQTAQGHLPSGKMASIWPRLGPGVGPRIEPDDPLVGSLSTQPLVAGQRADDTADGKFYALNGPHTGLHSVDLPGSYEAGCIIRPDGCVLGPATPELCHLAHALNRNLAQRSWLG